MEPADEAEALRLDIFTPPGLGFRVQGLGLDISTPPLGLGFSVCGIKPKPKTLNQEV